VLTELIVIAMIAATFRSIDLSFNALRFGAPKVQPVKRKVNRNWLWSTNAARVVRASLAR
jgi:hypothetical protein